MTRDPFRESDPAVPGVRETPEAKVARERELARLIEGLCRGTVTAADRDRLETLLHDPVNRAYYLAASRLHSALLWRWHHGKIATLERTSGSSRPVRQLLADPQRWRYSSLLLGAATMLVSGCGIGSAATSLVFAFSGLIGSPAAAVVMPAAPVIVHAESFESPPAPLQDHLPTKLDEWGGDETVVVMAERGVVPQSGRHMLRFLSGHPHGMRYVGKASEIWRVIDAETLRRTAGTREVRVTIAASFNGVLPPGVSPVDCLVGAIATDVHPVDLGERWRTLFDIAEGASDRIAIGQQSTTIDENPFTWQRLTATVMVPTEARYLVLYCLACTRPADGITPSAAEYIDDIRVSVSPGDVPVAATGPDSQTGVTR